MEVTWLASYPKSGNTWIRFLLTAYFSGDVPGWDGVSQVVLEFPSFLAQARNAGDSNETLWQRLVEADLRSPSRQPDFPDDLFLKTHNTCTADHPFIERTKRVVLVLRNPRDIALSAINYLRLMGKRVIDDERTYLQDFADCGGDPVWKKHGYGTWEGHTDSWLRQSRFPVLLVKYENLHLDAVSELERIIRFIDAPLDRDRLVRATKLAEFRNLREFENKRRQQGPLFPGHDKQLFMHRGEVRNSLATVGVDLDRRFEKAFHKGMRQFGYAA